MAAPLRRESSGCGCSKQCTARLGRRTNPITSALGYVSRVHLCKRSAMDLLLAATKPVLPLDLFDTLCSNGPCCNRLAWLGQVSGRDHQCTAPLIIAVGRMARPVTSSELPCLNGSTSWIH
eukprot:jgi/Ulvmu1/7315/UM035_0104.1